MSITEIFLLISSLTSLFVALRLNYQNYNLVIDLLGSLETQIVLAEENINLLKQIEHMKNLQNAQK
jgi:hypothetical protein